MAKETVLIGCRLPNGMILRLKQEGKNEETEIQLKGCAGELLESGLYLPPKNYSTTEVPADFWEAWKAQYSGYPPLKNRAIFEARSEDEAKGKAKDAGKTGFEQMPQSVISNGMKIEKAA